MYPYLTNENLPEKCGKVAEKFGPARVYIHSYQDPLLLTWFNFNPAWISNYILGKVWDEITYPFLNLNGCTVEV